ncbi:MAG: ATP-binding protein [Alphaproteobacteria bacterium]
MFQRFIAENLKKAAQDTPVIMMCGARQTGKSTLLMNFGQGIPKLKYKTLDDLTTRSFAQQNPQDFLEGLATPLILDEVQHVPELFQAIKYFVDRDRKPGQYFLTGSANVMTLPKLSESLAGRIELQTLWPLSQGEFLGQQETFIDQLFSADFSPKLEATPVDLYKAILTGGYPEVALRDSSRHNAWFKSYLETILQRDITALSHIEKLSHMPDLLMLLAARVGGVMNISDISRSIRLPNTTLVRYLALLESIFLILVIQPWHTNLSSRIVKSPKVYLNDTGILGYLVGATNESLMMNRNLLGQLLENFVLMELVKQIGWNNTSVRLFHFRTHAGHEVDFVLESFDGRVVGIEVKSASAVGTKASQGLHALKEIAGTRFHRGIILYTGQETVAFAKDMFLLPISALWQLTR